MALNKINYLSSINLNGLELQNASLHPLSAEPAVGPAGAVYYHTGTNLLKVSDGTNWTSVSGDITGVLSGNGLTGGDTAGSVTLTVVGGTGITSSASGVAISDGGVDTTQLAANSVTLGKMATIGENTFIGSNMAGAQDPQEISAGDARSILNVADGANNYSLPTASPTVLGGIKVGTNLSIAAGVLSSSFTNTQLTDEAVQDIVGAMLTGNTETNIAVTYQDGDGTIDFASTDTTYSAAGSGGLSLASTAFSVDSTVVRTTGAQSIAGVKTFSDNMILSGNLTVNGTTTSVNSNTVNIGDNIIVLNSDEAGTPSQNGGLEVERGTSANVLMQFKEAGDRWEFTNDGTTYYNIPISTEYNNYSHPLNGLDGDADVSGDWGIINHIRVDDHGHINNSDGITMDTIQTVTASSTVEGLVELATVTEVKTGTATNRAVTPAGIAALTYAVSVGNGVLTSVPVTHSLGTRDVIVQVYDNTTFDTVYVETIRTSTSVVTLEFVTAPTTNKYRVVVSRG